MQLDHGSRFVIAALGRPWTKAHTKGRFETVQAQPPLGRNRRWRSLACIEVHYAVAEREELLGAEWFGEEVGHHVILGSVITCRPARGRSVRRVALPHVHTGTKAFAQPDEIYLMWAG